MIDLGENKMEMEKALCFVLDGQEPQAKKRRKSNKKAAPTAVTFGAKMDLAKLVQCKAFEIAWRVRPGFFDCIKASMHDGEMSHKNSSWPW